MSDDVSLLSTGVAPSDDNSQQNIAHRPGYCKRLVNFHKYTWFMTLIFFSAILCIVLFFIGILFTPQIPLYSICNQNIYWGSILSSIFNMKAGVEVELRISVYNPNRFDIMLHQLVMEMYYESIHVATAHTIKKDQLVSYKRPLDIPHNWFHDDTLYINDNNMINIFTNDNDTFLINNTPEKATLLPYETSLSNISHDQFDISTLNNPSNQSIILNNTNKPSNILSNLKDKVFPDVDILLPAGSITDMYMLAFIDPPVATATSMYFDWLNSKLFINAHMEFHTGVFYKSSPQVKYNATTHFDDINATEESDLQWCLCHAPT